MEILEYYVDFSFGSFLPIYSMISIGALGGTSLVRSLRCFLFLIIKVNGINNLNMSLRHYSNNVFIRNDIASIILTCIIIIICWKNIICPLYCREYYYHYQLLQLRPFVHLISSQQTFQNSAWTVWKACTYVIDEKTVAI